MVCAVPIHLGEDTQSALIDTGSTMSLCSAECFKAIKTNKKVVKKILKSNQSAISASGDRMVFLTSADIHFKIAHFSWTFRFQIAPTLPTPVILGADFLHKTGAVIDMSRFHVTFPYGTHTAMAMIPSDLRDTEGDAEGSYKLGEDLTPQQTQRIHDLMARYPNTVTKRLGRTHLIEYEIKVNSTQAVRARPYQFAPPKLQLLREHVDDMLQKGLIRQSSSQYSCPAFLVPKKGNKTRFVVNYKQLNNVIDLEATPMPTIESAFQYLGNARWYTLLDLNSAYMQIPLAEESKKYTSFVVPWAQMEYNVLPFGLSTGSQVLTRLIDRIFGDIKYRYIFNFFDDLVIYSDGSFDQHLQQLEEVIQRLQRAGLTINPEKMTVASRQIEFLGHVFRNGTVSFHEDKVRPILECPPPKNVRQVARLVGMMAYYAKFIPNFAQLSAPLNHLKRKNVPFRWGAEQQKAFEDLKKVLTSHPVLRLPDFSKPFILQTDGSGTGLGAHLAQDYDGNLLPVAYASRPLSKHEVNRPPLELECLAVVFGLNKFQQYLEHREFQLQTDCSALSWLLNHPRQVGKIARWVTFINAFKFKSQHIRGDANPVADCLSRLYEEEGTSPTSIPMATTRSEPRVNILLKLPEAFKDIRSHQHDDPELIKIIRDPARSQAYSIKEGVLMHTSPGQKTPRVVLPRKLWDMIFRYYHLDPSSAHLGIKKTINKISRFFWAQDLASNITNRVRTCVQCQRAKQAPNSKLGLLASEVATRPFQRVFVDFVGPLPRSKAGNAYLLTVVDAFSKFIILVPTRNQTASTTVRALTRHVFSHYGFPEYLVSDNGTNFRSNLMRDLCLSCGIKHVFTSPYNPGANNVERVNKNIKVAMRIYHQSDHQTWDQHLHWFQVAFNSARHDSTGATPAGIFLGRELNHPLELAWELKTLVPQEPSVSTEQRWQRALENLQRARRNREQYYNKDRLPNPFKPGDWVLYRVHNQSSAAEHINAKLLPRWSQPCIIERFTSPVTVRLVKPTTGKLVTTTHISTLKRFFHPRD